MLICFALAVWARLFSRIYTAAVWGVLPLMTSDSSTDDAKACRAVKLYSFGVQYDEYCDILQHPVLSLKARKILNPKREL